MNELPQAADIILYPANGRSALSSRLVAAAEILAKKGDGFEQYSHAAILSDDPKRQYEAVFPWSRYDLIDTSRPYEIWRIGDPTPLQRRLIIGWCRRHVPRVYNLLGVLTDDRIRIPGTYYCSQFAGEAYADASIKIGDAIMSPDSIPDTPGAQLVWRYKPNA